MTCGGGTKTISREVVQEPEHGGALCPALEETMVCNTEECTGTTVKVSGVEFIFQLVSVYKLLKLDIKEKVSTLVCG